MRTRSKRRKEDTRMTEDKEDETEGSNILRLKSQQMHKI